MPPKKTTAAGAKKAKTPSSHGSYQDMIIEAISALKERSGSSRQQLKKYVQANNNLSGVTDAQFTAQFNRALLRGSESGVFDRPKGASGPVKLGGPKSAKAPAAAKTTTTKTTNKAPAKAKTTKAAATKKAPAKTAAKKTTAAKKAPAKKAAATKSKANTSTKRTKAPKPGPAPAVEEKAPVVLGKTKSGRVTKSTQAQPTKKATFTKRKAPAKKATPKKTATHRAKA